MSNADNKIGAIQELIAQYNCKKLTAKEVLIQIKDNIKYYNARKDTEFNNCDECSICGTTDMPIKTTGIGEEYYFCTKCKKKHLSKYALNKFKNEEIADDKYTQEYIRKNKRKMQKYITNEINKLNKKLKRLTMRY